MKKISRFILFLLIGAVITGCNKENTSDQVVEEPHLSGYVTNKDENRILVVSPIAQDFSENGGVKEYYDAAWVGNVTIDVEIGGRVEVWFDGGVNESYPKQGSARKISVIPSESPNNAKMNESEAIKKAIEQFQLVDDQAFIKVKHVNYNKETSTWEIQINEESIQIHEKSAIVKVYKMKSFSEVIEDSLITFADPKVVKSFSTSFKNAKKESGIVNIVDPDYTVELKNESYFLWISAEHGTIMYKNDTHHIYTLSKKATKMIYGLLN
ncbi:YobA family protein [Cytobacillus sp. FJAT-53684]|uniref:YobA family protein n=1 Tax=Cytobacillus mangrovibacter TaxID=3299024 RepID=A0ABW6JX14_9BACI